ncbi:MAG: lactoylglutathione lyase [Candidatus Azotimanducaceae bacterium]|jgi:lactoylglutathione lyase
MARLNLGYANFFVSDFDQTMTFFRDQLGLKVSKEDASFGYASFATGPAQIAFACSTDQPDLIGRHTGIGLLTDDIHAAYEELRAAGVEFEMAPTQQPWGGILALFKDPDGNIFYLDQEQPH